MDRLREVFTYVCAAVGSFALIFALYQAVNEKLSSAAFLFLIFALCGMYVFIAQIKAFKVWQIEVQLRERLNEADTTLAQLRQVAIVNAKAVYRNIGKGSRWAGHNTVENQALIDEIDEQLKKLNVSDQDRRVLSAPYLQIAGFDFYMMFIQTLERYTTFKGQDITRRAGKDPENVALQEELKRWRAGPRFQWNTQLFSQLEAYSLPDELGRIHIGWLSDPEQKAVDAFRNQILTLWKASVQKGSLTNEAANYYDRYHGPGGQDRKIIELFNFNPSELRYLKLHGSSNWYTEDQSSMLIVGGQKQTAISKHPLLQSYFDYFAKSICSADAKLMIIGYGTHDQPQFGEASLSNDPGAGRFSSGYITAAD